MEQIERDLQLLSDRKAAWARLPVGTKIDYLRAAKEQLGSIAAEWVAAAGSHKGLKPGSALHGEEWMSGPWATAYALNRYIETLQAIHDRGEVRVDPRRVRTRADGHTVVDVFPNSAADRMLFSGVRAETWMRPGVTPKNLHDTTAIFYREEDHQGRLALVLGAGNIASIPPLDVLYKFVAEGAVCMLKMNPVNEYLGPLFERLFEPFVTAGFLRFAYGGADVGKYLCSHALVDEIHITGSDKTHDAIVYGDGAEGQARKQRREPVLRKPITSELGNVSPTIVVPGNWGSADFRFQAEQIATQKLHNAGFNCIASQVVVLPEAWDGTPRLLEELARVFASAEDRPAYYPGAAHRHSRMLESGSARTFGSSDATHVPRTLLRADARDEKTFREEAFCSVLVWTTLAGDPETYMRRATEFANQTLWGTLGANVVVDPHTARRYASGLDEMLAALQYGTIGVNAWTGIGYSLADVPWGAYPGHPLHDIKSGSGVVHNAFLFSQSEKSIVYAPFAPFPRSFVTGERTLLPKPPWFVTHRKASTVGERLFAFEMRRTPARLFPVIAAALAG